MKTTKLAVIALTIPIATVVIWLAAIVGARYLSWDFVSLILIVAIGRPLMWVSPICSLAGVLFSVYALRNATDKTTARGLLLANAALLVAVSVAIAADFHRRDDIASRALRKHEQYLTTRTPVEHLFDAISDRNLKDVTALLNNNVDANAVNKNGMSALYFAIIYKQDANLVKCLLDHGAKGPVALHLAATGANVEIVKMLIDRGWDPMSKQQLKKEEPMASPLDLAIGYRANGHSSVEVIDYLKKYEINAEVPNEPSRDPARD